MSKLLAEKVATVGGTGDEMEFSKAFSGIAYSAIRDKAPRLLDYLVGFQLIDRNEDNSKAFGAFGFKLDKQWVLAPVFFLNGEVKGHEVLYLKGSDTCVPLKEDWVNSVMSQMPYEVGENSGVRTLAELGGSKPMLRALSVPPSQAYGKWAGDTLSDIPIFEDSEWAEPFLPLFAALKEKYASAIYADVPPVILNYDAVVRDPLGAAFAEIGTQFDLGAALTSDPVLFKAAYDAAEQLPFIKAAFQLFYGADCFENWAVESLKNFHRDQSNVMPVSIAKIAALSPSLITDAPVEAPPTHPVKSGALRIYFSHSVLGSAEPLSDDDKTKLMRRGRLIKDTRKSDQVSQILTRKTHFKIENPPETGLYDVLEADGTKDKMFVIVHGVGGSRQGRTATLVRADKSDTKSWLVTYLSNIFVEKQYDGDDWTKWWKSLSEVTSMTPGNEYIAIHPDGTSTIPFFVNDKLGDSEYRIRFVSDTVGDESIEGSRALSFERLNARSSRPEYPFGSVLRIVKETEARKLRQTNTYVQVPSNCRVLKLSDNTPQPASFISVEPEKTKGKPIRPGDSHDVARLIFAKTAGLSVWRDRNEILLKQASSVERVRESDAVWTLVSEHGLTEDDAEFVVKQASVDPQEYRVLYAPGFGPEKAALEMTRDPRYTNNSADFDAMNARASMQVSPRSEANFQPSYSMSQPVPELMASNQDLSNWNIWQNYLAEDFNHVKQVARVAASRGQKEVFDVSMFTGLAKAVSKDTLVERYLPALVRALDSLGRLLLSFYWHSAEFADRYGKQDLPELEDSLRNAFDAIGSVTLFLKEKTIETPLSKGDIDLDDAARI